MKTPSRSILSFPLASAILCATFALTANAQCPPTWLPSQGLAGLNESAYCSTMWDSDGPGPLTPVVVVGGRFTIAGNIIVNGIATWNLATSQWAALGAGFGPDTSGDAMRVTALLALPNGDLIAGGNFGTADGAPANYIARWNGTRWGSLGNGMSGVQYPIVTSLATMPNGDIVAGGDFTFADGIAANDIARWNGSTWSPLVGPSLRQVYAVSALAVLPDGRLAASSGFPNYSTGRIDIWDGSDWTDIASSSGTVQALNVLPTGELLAGGGFSTIGGITASGTAIWNGTTWRSLGSGPLTHISSMVVEPDGDIVVCGSNNGNYNSSSRGRMRRWNGSTWSDVITQIPDRPIYTSTQLPDGSILIGGEFHQITGELTSPQAGRVARVASGTCYALSPGMNFEVGAFLTLPGGDIIVGGDYVLYYATYYSAIINRWNGSTWSPLGPTLSGVNNSNSYVAALALRPGGEIIAGGLFTNAGATVVNNIASWDGTNWRPLSTGLSGTVYALATLPNGHVVAAGSFTSSGSTSLTNIARWDGSQWFPLALGLSGEPFTNANVYALLALPNGDLIAGGAFTKTGTFVLGHIARWNGTIWSRVGGSVLTDVYALAALPDGSIVANGLSNGVGRWNGTAWSRLGGTFDGNILSLKTLANGNLIAGGQFTRASLTLANGIAQWDGTTWSPLGTGISSTDPPSYPRYVAALTESPSGILNVGGYFETAGDLVSPYFARYAFTLIEPSITQHPAFLTICPAATANFSVTAAGTDPLSYHWQYESPANNWTDLDEGTNTNIGFITGVHSPSISITNLGSAAASNYRVVITNTCGTIISNPAALTLCHADFNCDNTTDFFDYLDFVQAFADNDPTADFNNDAVIDYFDYLAFVQSFSTGC